MSRRVEVGAGRLPRWVAGFAERHGEPTAQVTGESLELRGADGALAAIQVPFAPWVPPDGESPVEALATAVAAHAAAPRRVAVLVVRRGGYGAILVENGAVGASKVGRRHVQGRTAAGGWSQQRFARRRQKQADELADAAAATAGRVLASDPPPDWLVTGGDRPLVEQVLADPALRALARLPRAQHLAVGDPDARFVAGLPELLTRVSVLVTEPTLP